MIQLDKLCSLSQIDLSHVSDADKRIITSQLASMIELADKVRIADIDNLAPLFHPLELSQPLRKDLVVPTDNYRQSLLINAPKHDEVSFLVPKIIE